MTAPTLFRIDGELVLLTGLTNSNLTWAVQRGMNGTTPSAHAVPGEGLTISGSDILEPPAGVEPATC
jgi:hypothetical protein